MPNMGIKAAVLDFLVARPGVPSSTDLVSERTGITRNRVLQALAALVVDGNAGVIRVSHGVYAYIGPAAPAKPDVITVPTAVSRAPKLRIGLAAGQFTVIGKNKADEVLVRDDNTGVVYRLVEV